MDVSEPEHSASRRSSKQDYDESCRYKMDYPEKGKCVIINMETFSFQGFKKREGTDKDAESLKIIFTKMGFKVETLKDKTCQEIFDYLQAVAGEDHSKISCFVCIIMSHGDEKGIYGYDDCFMKENLFGLFEENACRSLAGKPKLFFIQACRGKSCDSGITPYNDADEKTTSEICIDADFLCHYSTPQGYASWRNRTDGSWFVQTLCEKLEAHWENDDLMYILTLVNNKVATAYESDTKTHEKKQMPCIVSKLTKDLYLY